MQENIIKTLFRINNVFPNTHNVFLLIKLIKSKIKMFVTETETLLWTAILVYFVATVYYLAKYPV